MSMDEKGQDIDCLMFFINKSCIREPTHTLKKLW